MDANCADGGREEVKVRDRTAEEDQDCYLREHGLWPDRTGKWDASSFSFPSQFIQKYHFLFSPWFVLDG